MRFYFLLIYEGNQSNTKNSSFRFFHEEIRSEKELKKLHQDKAIKGG